jgi:hypothetical protein
MNFAYALCEWTIRPNRTVVLVSDFEIGIATAFVQICKCPEVLAVRSLENGGF